MRTISVELRGERRGPARALGHPFSVEVTDRGRLGRAFFLHVSNKEQRKRFLSRIEEPEKNWKFSASDAREREYWDEYMDAYGDMIRSTATKRAPWYVVPADAPLRGLGQRLFFRHDGRTSDLLEAIQAHARAGNGRFRASEANGVVRAYNRLTEKQEQDVLNFLRSL